MIKNLLACLNSRVGEKGVVLPIILAYVLIFSLEAAGMAIYASSTLMQVQAHENHIRTFYIAEAASEKAVADIRSHFALTGSPPTQDHLDAYASDPAFIGTGFEYILPEPDTEPDREITMTLGPSVTGLLTAGDYEGLNAATSTIQINVSVRGLLGRDPTEVTVTQDVEIQLIPVFQFGVFYQNDLEILPGPDMTFAGPVHSNSDIYVGAGTGSTLTFDSGITAVGDIIHDRKDDPGEVKDGDIMIKNNASPAEELNMKLDDDTWLDVLHDDWILESQNRWGGRVKSGVHGTNQLNLPLPTSSEAHDIIERKSVDDTPDLVAQKMEYKAQIRIIDGVVMDSGDNVLDLRYCADGSGNPLDFALDAECLNNGGDILNPLDTTRTFKNWREGKTINALDIDIERLQKSPIFQQIDANTPGGVIIYHSDIRNMSSGTNQDAMRLVNGQAVPQEGITFVSENPVYVKGDFNLDNPSTVGVNEKRPVGIVSDAFNILSNSWNDSNSWSNNTGDRVAGDTKVNAAIISGNSETTVGDYNGGFENIHRFLEKWSGKTLNYAGSVAILFTSETATGDWKYGNPQYQAPIRAWGYDTDLSNPNYVVPGFPSVYNIVKKDWQLD